jgi:transcriptional regulator with XRE-family HTH domain
MEKDLSFKEKIDIILKLKKLSIKKIEKELGVDGTFYKAYNENREPREALLAEFLRRFHVAPGWWRSPKGRAEADIFTEKPTYVELPTKKEDPDERIRILIKNLDRMGELNEYLLKELKRLQGS